MRTVGEGTIKKVIVVVVVFAAVIGIGTWYGPFAQSYEMKNAMKIGCNGAIKLMRFPGAPNNWEEEFLRRAKNVGVQLKPTQYKFTTERDKQKQESLCNAKVIYRTKAEIWLIGDIFALTPVDTDKMISIEHRVADSF